MKNSISLIVPAHDEERRIGPTLESFTKLLKNYDHEIIVVCDNCKDNTKLIVNNFIKKNKNIKKIEYNGRRGKGNAILQGLKIAKKDLIGFMDSDDAFEHKYIHMIINTLKNEDHDCIIASKWKGQSFEKVNESTTRKILAVGWNMLSKIFLNLDLTDTQAGAKFLTKRAFDRIDKNFICTGFDFDVELLYKLKRNGFKVKEIYVPTKQREFSTFHLRYIPGMFYRLIRLWGKRF